MPLLWGSNLLSLSPQCTTGADEYLCSSDEKLKWKYGEVAKDLPPELLTDWRNREQNESKTIFELGKMMVLLTELGKSGKGTFPEGRRSI